MCYYTLTLDHNDSDGHIRAIMILDEKDEIAAKARFVNTFGSQYFTDVDLIKGIHIPQGFDRLLTEQVRKYILKAKGDKKDAPLLSYQNMIRLNHK
jgi:hypothetical protein